MAVFGVDIDAATRPEQVLDFGDTNKDRRMTQMLVGDGRCHIAARIVLR